MKQPVINLILPNGGRTGFNPVPFPKNKKMNARSLTGIFTEDDNNSSVTPVAMIGIFKFKGSINRIRFFRQNGFEQEIISNC